MLNLKKDNSIKIIVLILCIALTGARLMIIFKQYKYNDMSYSSQLIDIIDRDEESQLTERELYNYEKEINKELSSRLKENKDNFKMKQSYYAIGAIEYLKNNNNKSIEYLNKALEYGGIDDVDKKNTQLDVNIYSALSSNYIAKKDLEKSNTFFEQAKTVALKNNRRDLLCELYYGKAKSITSAGYNINESIDLMRKALEYTDLETHRIRNYIYLSSLYKLSEDFNLALEYTIDALDIALKIEDSVYINKCIISLGEIYYTQNNYSKTIYVYESHFKNHQLLNKENKLKVYGYLAECYAKEGNYAKYKMYREKYIYLATKENDVKNLVWIYSVCADLELENSNIDEAKKYLNKAKYLYNKNKDYMYLNSGTVLEFIENKIVYIENKDYDKALNNYKVLLKELNDRGVKSDINSIIVDEVLRISLENDDFTTFKEYIKAYNDNGKKESSQTYTDSIYTGISNNIKAKKLLKEQIKTLVLFVLSVVSIYALINSKLKNKKIKKLNLELKQMSIIDPLTSLYNRAYLTEKCREVISKKEKITFIMIDIDYFKLYNDNYGHINGDKVLAKVASIVKSTFKDDIVFRYGGEEFSIISYKSIAEVIVYIEELQAKLRSENIEHSYSKVSDRVTISIGLASKQIDNEHDVIELTKMADKNLYKSKEKGRNIYTY